MKLPLTLTHPVNRRAFTWAAAGLVTGAVVGAGGSACLAADDEQSPALAELTLPAVDVTPDQFVPLPGAGLKVYLIGNTTTHRVRWERTTPNTFRIIDTDAAGNERMFTLTVHDEQPGRHLATLNDTFSALSVFKADAKEQQ